MAFNFEQFGTEVTEPKNKVGGFDFESFGTEVAPTEKESKKRLVGVRQDITRRAEKLATGIEAGQTLPETVLQTAGQAVGLGADIAFRGLGAVTPRFIKEPLARGVEAIAGIAPVRRLTREIGEFAEAHPRLARNIEAGFEVAGVIPVGRGASIAGKAAFREAEQIAKQATKVIGPKIEERVAKRALDQAIELTAPTLRKKQTIEAIERAGRPGGIVERGRIFKKFEVAPSIRDIEVAKSVKGLVKTRNSFVRNVQNVTDEVERISEKEVLPFLQKNPAPFNNNQFRAFLKKDIEIPKLFTSEPSAQKAYQGVIDTAIEVQSRGINTMEGSWNARKAFDQEFRRQFGDAVHNPNNPLHAPVKRAYLDVRRSWNKFIIKNTPKVDNVFEERMKRLARMYEARENIATRHWREINSTAFRRWASQNPGTWNAIRWGLGASVPFGAGSLFF